MLADTSIRVTNGRHDRLPLAPVRLGTRGSALALAQTDLVTASFQALHPEFAVERVVIRTDGDVDKTSPLTVIGGRGVFTSALEEALRRGIIDAAAHSAKDLPSESPTGLALTAFCHRVDPRDVLVSRHGCPLLELPERPLIGTSSRRRGVQVLALRPDARIVELRGNIDTRLRKALGTDLDGVILAAAGIARMGWEDRVTEYLPLDRFVPSPGQGALAIETRVAPTGPAALLVELDDPLVSLPVRTERAFLRGIGGGCTTPVGAHAVLDDDRLSLRCMVASEDGAHVAWADETFARAGAEDGAYDLARRLLREVGGVTRSFHAIGGPRPLAGLRILVTRAQTQAGDLEDALRAAGAVPILAPTIRIVGPTDPASLDGAIRQLAAGSYDWAVFTSGNAVDQMLVRSRLLGLPLCTGAATQVAAVGAATAVRLRAAGIAVSLVPERADGEAVRDALLATGIAGKRVLLPRGNLARDVIVDGLRSAGAEVESVEAYRTLPETELDGAVRAQIEGGEIDVATFASPSTVRSLATLLPGGLGALFGSTIACAGPVTAAAAREHALRVDIVAEDATFSGLVTALIENRDRIDATRAERERVAAGSLERAGG